MLKQNNLPARAQVNSVPLESGSLCHELASALLTSARPITLIGDRLLAAEAMGLLIRLDRQILEARAQWNQDWFRRVMHARSRAVARLRRRWCNVDPRPSVGLGTLKRRYHANLAKYVYEPTK
jgi:hypothetical protein